VLDLFAGCSGRIAGDIASSVTLLVPPDQARPEARLDNLQTTFKPTDHSVEPRILEPVEGPEDPP